MRRLLPLLIFLSGCVAQKPATQENFSFFFSANRYLELEPCGCSAVPVGGLEREWSFRKAKNSAKAYSFLSGPTFVPKPGTYKKTQQSHFDLKAKTLVSALNQLGTTSVSIAADDLALGVDRIRELEKQAKFKFISTNIVDKESNKPLFPTHLRLRAKNGEILVLGVSDPLVRNYPENKEIVVRDPKTAIEEVLKSLPEEPRLVVLLSTLSLKTQIALEKAFPKINLVLGSQEREESPSSPYWIRDNLVRVKTEPDGRQVAYFEVDLKLPIDVLYNKEVARFSGSRNFSPQATISNYAWALERLSDKYDGANPMRSLLESFKGKVRSLALEK